MLQVGAKELEQQAAELVREIDFVVQLQIDAAYQRFAGIDVGLNDVAATGERSDGRQPASAWITKDLAAGERVAGVAALIEEHTGGDSGDLVLEIDVVVIDAAGEARQLSRGKVEPDGEGIGPLGPEIGITALRAGKLTSGALGNRIRGAAVAVLGRLDTGSLALLEGEHGRRRNRAVGVEGR